MNGVKFGDKHSIKDWDLLMVAKDIGEPSVIANYLQIPGRDGELDLTEALGGIKYSSRNLMFHFDIFHSPSEWWKLKSAISNYLHGKKHKIVLDVDNKYYYLGRCEVSEFSHETNIAHLTISCKCDPYKYKHKITKRIFNVNVGEIGKILSVYNEKRKVVPMINVDQDITLKFRDYVYHFEKGDNINFNILLNEGENIFEVISNSSNTIITFSYQEATL